MLDVLGATLGRPLEPAHLVHPSGAQVRVDGMDDQRTVLVECWAHQGRARGSQPAKLMSDAVKLHWIAQTFDTTPELILCVSDKEAVQHLFGKSWRGRAIESLGVQIRHVDVAAEVMASVATAQLRQFR